MQAALRESELHRVAEYFDGDMHSTRRFIEAVWLPDARKTLGQLARALGMRPSPKLGFLCDHLREGSRTVGAITLLELATRIERRVLEGDFERAADLVWDGIVMVRDAEQLLQRLR